MKAIATPLLVYLSVTIVVPWLNGAGNSEGFWEHVGVVLIVSLGVVALALATARCVAEAPAQRQ